VTLEWWNQPGIEDYINRAAAGRLSHEVIRVLATIAESEGGIGICDLYFYLVSRVGNDQMRAEFAAGVATQGFKEFATSRTSPRSKCI
jgi:hypothetical protein